MRMENVLRNSVPLLRNVALRQRNFFIFLFFWGGGCGVRSGQKCFIYKMFPNKPKDDVEYFLSCTIKMHAVVEG